MTSSVKNMDDFIGKRVKIIEEYHPHFKEYGTAVRVSDAWDWLPGVVVRLENNPDGIQECCVFSLAHLRLAADDERERPKIVQIAFAGNYEMLYDFFTDLDKLQVGDLVVCHTVRCYSVGKVAGFVEKSTKATNWIVQKVDVEGHQARVERERLARELDEMLG